MGGHKRKEDGQRDRRTRSRSSKRLKRVSGTFPIVAASLLFLCFSFSSSLVRDAKGTNEQSTLQAGSGAIDIAAERSRILSAMESKIDNPKLMEAARSKLLLMDEKQTRLLSGLSDHMVADCSSIASNVALLLITTLITLL